MDEKESVIRLPAQGVELEGVLRIPEGARSLVIFSHGAGSDRRSPRNLLAAERLEGEGIATLLFDLLTPEERETYKENVFDIDRLSARLVDVTRWIMAREAARGLKIGYLGASTGAAAALNAAAELGPAVSAVVSRGGRPDLADQDRLPAVSAATIFIIGGDDVDVIEASRSPYGRLTCAKGFELVPGATHVFEEPGTLEQAVTLAVDWLKRYLS